MVTLSRRGGQGGRGRGAALLPALFLALLGLTTAPAARAAQDVPAAIARCQELVPGFDEHPGPVLSEVQGNPDKVLGVRLTWKRSDGDHPEDWIICWFLPISRDQRSLADRRAPDQEPRDDDPLRRAAALQDALAAHPRQHQARLHPAAVTAPTWIARLLYLLQQTINGITIGCLYALLAVAFNLIYGIVRFINLAFGELYMIGAFATYLAYAVTIHLGGSFTLLPILATAAYVIVTGALAGWTTNHLVFSRLRASASTVPLIASIALAILISNTVLILQGPKTRWMPQFQHSAWRIVEGLGYDVYLRKGHVFVGIGTACIAAFLWWVARRSNLGRSYRACAQDPKMAALVGVDVRGTIGLSFALSGALTGAAGLFEALQYNAVDFHMGFIVAIKALTAALLGGSARCPARWPGDSSWRHRNLCGYGHRLRVAGYRRFSACWRWFWCFGRPGSSAP
jgi:Branched-chain amino acid ABC-type transport system, permease components